MRLPALLCFMATALLVASIAQPAFGQAIGYVQVASATPQSATATVSVTYPAAQMAGDMNIVVVGWNDTTATVSSVTDSAGNSYKLAIGPTSGSALRQSIYYAPNIVAGSNTVTVTFSTAAAYADIRILEYRGVTTLDVTAGASGSGTSASSGSATTTSANELIFGADTIATTTTAAGRGFTARIITSPDSDVAEDRTVTTTGSNSATASLSSGAWVMQMATFSNVSASPAGTLSGLSCSSGSMTGAGTDNCTVSLTGAAGTGGLTVTLSSSDSSVTVPGSVTVPAGSASASFTATVSAVTSAQTATLTASAGGVTRTYAISLGAAAPALTLSTASMSFGSVTVSDPATRSITLTSSGTAPLTINSAAVSGSGYSLSGASFPMTLNPGQTTTLSVVFDPTATGTATGSIVITDNGSPNTASVSLSGTGQSAPAPTVTGISPNSGPPAGGTAVTITGTNFVSGATVTFGSSAASSVTVVNSTTITATSPAGSAGAVAITVTSNGQSGSLAGGFTYNAPGDISYVQVASATPQSTTATVSVSFAAAETAGDMNIVVVGWNDTTAAVQSVTDSAGNVYALAAGPISGTALRQSIYYAPHIMAGSNTVTVTFNTAAAYPDIRILEYQGVTTLDVTAGASGSGTSASSGSATTTSANELIFGADTISTGTVGAGTGYTSRVITSPDSDLAEDKTVTSTGSNSATASLSSGAWVMQMATFSNVSAPPAGTLSGLSCSSGSLTGAGTDNCTVSLTGAAGTGGLTVALSSSDSSVTVPGSVTVPAGSASASFTATVSAVTSAQTATLTATAGGTAKTFAITLNATAVALTLGSTSIAFGNVNLNTTATQSVTLTSSGTAALTINAGSVTGTGFSVSGLSFPLTLNPGQTATLYIAFDPTVAGAATGAVTLSSNASPGTASIGLSGTGQSASYEVDLTWDAPTSSTDPVAGYNVYREISGGSSYQLLNTTVDANKTYADSTVQSGTSYSYYVESVDAQGNQSAPSNTYSVSIP
jgi:hypothetical protein